MASPKPKGWQLSPRTVRRFILGDKALEVQIGNQGQAGTGCGVPMLDLPADQRRQLDP